jgi:hypothetical protein
MKNKWFIFSHFYCWALLLSPAPVMAQSLSSVFIDPVEFSVKVYYTDKDEDFCPIITIANRIMNNGNKTIFLIKPSRSVDHKYMIDDLLIQDNIALVDLGGSWYYQPGYYHSSFLDFVVIHPNYTSEQFYDVSLCSSEHNLNSKLNFVLYIAYIEENSVVKNMILNNIIKFISDSDAQYIEQHINRIIIGPVLYNNEK